MRLIGALSEEMQARRLSIYLKNKGIANRFEKSTHENLYELWVYDEDLIETAKLILQEFKTNPSDPQFDVLMPAPILEEKQEGLKKDFRLKSARPRP